MKHILFGSDVNNVKVAIVIKGSALNKIKLDRYYIEPHTNLKAENFIAFDLAYDSSKKCSAKTAKAYIQELLPEIDNLGITTVMVCDTIYFKQLTKHKKTEPHNGYVCPCLIEGYEHLNIVLCSNYQAVVYNPDIQNKIDRAIKTIDKHMTGTYEDPGKGIIHSSYYPDTIADIKKTLEALHKFPELTCDIETTSLEFWNAGLSTISFAWDKHNGVAFGVERSTPSGHTSDGLPVNEPCWRNGEIINEIKQILKQFFTDYKGKVIYHNAGFDMKILVYELWMQDFQDYKGMIEGIKVITKNFDDTKLITYMATNNAVQNVLDLKSLSAEFVGDYAEDTTDTTKIPLPQLLEYNLKDCLATWYVKEKYEPIMINDQQQNVYETLLKDSVVTLMQTELCGMPIDPEKVQIAKSTLNDVVNECHNFFINSELIKTFHMGELITKAADKTKMAAENAKTDRATKIYKVTDSVIAYDFNPGSDTQLRRLLFDYLKYPILDYTKGKQASTGNKTIEKLKAHAKNEEHLQMFKYLLKLADASIILSTFIPAFENAQQMPDGSWRLFGNFNIGGTLSGRLSSSNPNLTNIPSHSVFAKLIKECFVAINRWLFAGADYNSLEAMISALTTNDVNKLKVYTEGMCSHCFNAYGYYTEQMPDIDPNSVESINSIKTKYPDLRQSSKTKTFLLTYGGSYHGLMNNEGLKEKDAKRIEHSYHTLYKQSDEWVANKIEQAKIDGYVTGAFGLRLRTPLLAKTVGKGRSIPYSAKAEARTAGNMLGQSYGMLNSRAANEFRKRVWKSKYIYDILPACQIHDACYILFRNNKHIAEWVNTNLIECMQWCELEELKHPTVKLGGELDIFYPSWNQGHTIPNNATKEEIKAICVDAQK